MDDALASIEEARKDSPRHHREIPDPEEPVQQIQTRICWTVNADGCAEDWRFTQSRWNHQQATTRSKSIATGLPSGPSVSISS